MRMLVAAVVVVTAAVSVSMAKRFEKCELATVLENKHNMSRDDIKNWVCIAEFESTFNTEAINTINWDGSYDYGLFQLNNKYWCKDDNKKGKNVCKMACTDLLDADLTDDLNCIKKIIKDTERWKGRGTGLTAWVAYQNKCKDRNLGDYISECWSGSTSSNIVSIRDESTIKNPAAQVTENADTAGVGAGGDSPIINNARVPIRFNTVPICANGICFPARLANPYSYIYQQTYYKKK
ncbi:lysozyme C-like [Homarus americanus]|uniref:lysozyme C-like n=1 Tax=Homarus americanus TaxID=6706 RepID=UPI001C46B67C|nr:lysozyme C-like [Homarus americanus]